MSKTGLDLSLVGQDGNAFMILGLASAAMKQGGVSDQYWDEYYEKATSGDYNHLLRTTMDYFEVY